MSVHHICSSKINYSIVIFPIQKHEVVEYCVPPQYVAMPHYVALNALGRYSTFQYPDQDAYQDAYPEDFKADILFHVSVSVKRICLFYLTLNSAYIKSLQFT